ncbi:hypothetical protein KC357_g41 [Hortaea werneckii]|nr:hypothetical protein KC357_g41 [Hortaea werneckii]
MCSRCDACTSSSEICEALSRCRTTAELMVLSFFSFFLFPNLLITHERHVGNGKERRANGPDEDPMILSNCSLLSSGQKSAGITINRFDDTQTACKGVHRTSVARYNGSVLCSVGTFHLLLVSTLFAILILVSTMHSAMTKTICSKWNEVGYTRFD